MLLFVTWYQGRLQHKLLLIYLTGHMFEMLDAKLWRLFRAELVWPIKLINYTASTRISSVSSAKSPLPMVSALIHQEGIKCVVPSVIKQWSEGA